MSADERESWPLHDQRIVSISTRCYGIQRVLRSIAAGPLSRARFISQIENCLTDPFFTYIRLLVASLNPNIPEDNEAWEEMAGQVEYELPAWFLHPTDGTFDRYKAAARAVKNLRGDEKHNHKAAIRILREFRKQTVRKTGPLPRAKVEEFFRWVDAILKIIVFEEENEASKKDRRRKTTRNIPGLNSGN